MTTTLLGETVKPVFENESGANRLNLEDVVMVTGRGLLGSDITHVICPLHVAIDALAIRHPQGNTHATGSETEIS